MAYFAKGICLDFDTDADLSASQYCIAKLTSGGKIVVAADGDAMPIGILTDNVADGSAATARVTVQLSGVAKLKVGGTITLATTHAIMGTTLGEGLQATTGKYHVAVPLEAGVDNDIISVLIALGQLD